MTKFEVSFYKTKYRFQRWWFSGGGKENVEAGVGAVCLGGLVYMGWLWAYLMEP